MKAVFKSLKARLLISMALLIIVILPTLMFTLEQAFKQHLELSVQNEITAQSYSILAIAEVEDNQLIMPEQLLQNKFNVINSGLYGFFLTPDKDILWQTASSLGVQIPEDFSLPAQGKTTFSNILINAVEHWVFNYSVSFDSGNASYPVTLVIIQDKTEFNSSLSEFRQQLFTWLFVIFIALIIVQLAWLYWTLMPLASFKKELAAIEEGQEQKITGNYPTELAQVTRQLNQLLAIEQQQRVTYRKALSNLAHSLKTPLAVMQNKLQESDNVEHELTQINQTIEHQLKRAQSAGESSWRLGCNILEVAENLLSALTKIYAHQGISYQIDIKRSLMFKGDKADLMELLGNLVDNASKAANSIVKVSALSNNQQLVIVVEDDGIGVSEQQKQQILQRGTRADTYEQGHGIGLAIVKDLVSSYQGQLIIDASELGGAKFSLVFSQ